MQISDMKIIFIVEVVSDNDRARCRAEIREQQYSRCGLRAVQA